MSRLSINPLPMTPPASTERIRFLEHQGVRIVLLDFQGLKDPAVSLPLAAAAKMFFARLKPDGSALSLTDVRGARYDRQIIEALKDLTTHNKPYVRAAAVVTNSPIHRAAITMVAMFSRRKLQVFETREPALEYLVAEHRAGQPEAIAAR